MSRAKSYRNNYFKLIFIQPRLHLSSLFRGWPEPNGMRLVIIFILSACCLTGISSCLMLRDSGLPLARVKEKTAAPGPAYSLPVADRQQQGPDAARLLSICRDTLLLLPEALGETAHPVLQAKKSIASLPSDTLKKKTAKSKRVRKTRDYGCISGCSSYVLMLAMLGVIYGIYAIPILHISFFAAMLFVLIATGMVWGVAELVDYLVNVDSAETYYERKHGRKPDE